MVVTPQPGSTVASNPAPSDMFIEDNTMNTSNAAMPGAAAFGALTGEGDPTRRAIIGAMGAIWGVLLALHLLFDRVLRGPEDGRYQMTREPFRTRISPLFFPSFSRKGCWLSCSLLRFSWPRETAGQAHPFSTCLVRQCGLKA